MTCDLNCVGRHLDRIATGLGEYSALDVWAVVISAFAAGGTIVIAIMNWVLLRGQHALEKQRDEEILRGRRVDFDGAIREMVLNWMLRVPPNEQQPFEEWIREEVELKRLGQLTKHDSHRRLLSLIRKRMKDFDATGSAKSVEAGNEAAMLVALSGAWTDDPDIDLSGREDTDLESG